jgi:signal transduction histidine kinase
MLLPALQSSEGPGGTDELDGPVHVARVPLVDADGPVGSIMCSRACTKPPFGEPDIALMNEVSSRLVPAITNARLRRSIEERQQRLDAALEQLVSIEESERRRVALCIHDGLAQVAASTYRYLEVFDSHYTSVNAQDASDLARAKELARRTIREARRLIADLRPTVLDEFGLISGLQAEIDDLRSCGWDVRFEHDLGDERFVPRIELDVFRLAQEALANVSKHAGTTRVDVCLHRLPGEIRLVVQDYGSGFDPDQLAHPSRSSEHVGLSGMKERVRLLGGSVAIQSRPGEGTRVTAHIPA